MRRTYELGTLQPAKAVLDRFGAQPEYALAAYNAGDVPVRQWMANRRVQGHRGVCGVDSVHGDAGLRAGDYAEPGDVSVACTGHRVR